MFKKPLKYYFKYVTVTSSDDSDYNSYILMTARQSFRHSDSLLTNPFKISREAEMFSCVHRKEVHMEENRKNILPEDARKALEEF